MNKIPAISVLVPVYNVEKTLKRCLDSILNQTFKNYEIILVNDGSTDNSGAICDEYAQMYDNISVIHKENEGLGPTRNRGIVEAKGEYIYHCDSDDWLKEDLLEKAYNNAIETNAEIVIFGYEIFTENNNEIKPYKDIRANKKIYNDKEEIRDLFIEQYFSSFVMMSACNRLCKRKFIVENDLYFPPLRRCQDMAYSLALFDKLNKLSIMDESFYCYVISPGVYKGRSYNEKIELYSIVNDLANEKFFAWGKLNNELKCKLNNLFCEQIANYSAHAFAVKYKNEWKKNSQWLINNKSIVTAFKKYVNIKKSKFMKLFKLALILRSKWLLLIISRYVQKKVFE